MLRTSLSISGVVSVLAGMLVFSQPALSSPAPFSSPLASPLTVSVTLTSTPTPAYTPPPTFTPQPTFTPLPPMTPTLTALPPVAAPVNPPPFSLDPVMVIGLGLLGLILLLLLIWALRRRSRRTAEQRATQPTAPVTPIAPPPTPTASLEFIDTAGNVVRLVLNTPSMTLGRAADNDLVVPDNVPEADTVSQHHAQFRRDQADYIVRDLNSQNGLTVNQRHTNHNVLQDGDQLGFGAAQATFRKSSGGAA